MEVIGTGDVANVSDLKPVDDLWVGVKGVGRLEFSFPRAN
jgi:2-keto-4-pentenoate hydratase/2-oxohepta-3-ene-1,7-dioic acid hydratase in catechol pathway